MNDTATLLTTDLAGSTARIESLGEAAAAALWREHDRAAALRFELPPRNRTGRVPRLKDLRG